MSYLIRLAVAFYVVSITGCAGSDIYIEADSQILSEQKVPKVAKEYFLGVDDTVSINVWKNPELSVTVPVRPDGKISLPLIGDVYAAGYTPEQVSESIKIKLRNYIRDPNVTVMVMGLKSHEYLTRVRVTGAVNKPISINYRQGMTVVDAVLEAGGVNDFAAANSTKLYRKIEDQTRVISIYLGDILYKGELETNIELRPRDIITVPERLF